MQDVTRQTLAKPSCITTAPRSACCIGSHAISASNRTCPRKFYKQKSMTWNFTKKINDFSLINPTISLKFRHKIARYCPTDTMCSYNLLLFLLYITDGLLRKLQSIQSTAAHLVTGARRCDHICIITPVLRQLHWLPVRQWVKYKVACLVHQSLAGQTPAYIADDIQLVTNSDRRELRSATTRTCLVPWTHNFSDRSFSAAGPCVWNSLLPHLRRDMNFAHFKHQLKTLLFWS